jgi:hypothetical protein
MQARPPPGRRPRKEERHARPVIGALEPRREIVLVNEGRLRRTKQHLSSTPAPK